MRFWRAAYLDGEMRLVQRIPASAAEISVNPMRDPAGLVKGSALKGAAAGAGTRVMIQKRRDFQSRDRGPLELLGESRPVMGLVGLTPEAGFGLKSEPTKASKTKARGRRAMELLRV